MCFKLNFSTWFNLQIFVEWKLLNLFQIVGFLWIFILLFWWLGGFDWVGFLDCFPFFSGAVKNFLLCFSNFLFCVKQYVPGPLDIRISNPWEIIFRLGKSNHPRKRFYELLEYFSMSNSLYRTPLLPQNIIINNILLGLCVPLKS